MKPYNYANNPPCGFSVQRNVINKPPKGSPKLTLLDKNWEVCQLGKPHALLDAVTQGYAVAPGIYNDGHKTKANFQQGQYLFLDFDDGSIQWADVENHPWFSKHALFAFTTASHTHECSRFRVVCVLPYPVKSAEEYDGIMRRLYEEEFHMADTSMKCAQASFGNNGAEVITWSWNNTVPEIKPLLVERVLNADRPESDEPLDSRISKAVACLKRLPVRISGAGTYPICFPALCSIVHEFGVQDGLKVIELAGWHGDWDVEQKMEDIEATASDATLMLGALIKQTRDYLGDDPNALEEFNLEIATINKELNPEQPVDPTTLFTPVDGGFVAGKFVGGSAIDQMPSPAEIAALHVQLEGEPIARKMRVMMDKLLGETSKIRFNELTQEIEVLGRGLKAYDYDTAEHWVDEVFGLMGAKSQAQNALKKVANRNRFHPVKEYLEYVGKTAPDVDLDLVAERVLGVTDQLSKAQIKAWLCGAVAKVWSEHGAPFIEVLTLISPRQGIGKSEFFKSLASPEWFGDSFAQTDQEKDRILCLHRSWINEISELDQFASKKDLKQLKGLVSTTTDTIRVPYGAVMESRPRQFVIGATANTQGLFSLDDEQRRFWAIEVHPTTDCGRLDIEWLRDNRDAIWGTAVRLFMEHGQESFKLSKEQRMSVINRNADTFQQTSHIEDKITQHLEEYDIRAISVPEVLEDICGMSNPGQKQMNEAGAILRRLGYERKENQVKCGQKFRTLWVNEQRSNDYNPNTHFTRKMFNPDIE